MKTKGREVPSKRKFKMEQGMEEYIDKGEKEKGDTLPEESKSYGTSSELQTSEKERDETMEIRAQHEMESEKVEGLYEQQLKSVKAELKKLKLQEEYLREKGIYQQELLKEWEQDYEELLELLEECERCRQECSTYFQVLLSHYQ